MSSIQRFFWNRIRGQMSTSSCGASIKGGQIGQ